MLVTKTAEGCTQGRAVIRWLSKRIRSPIRPIEKELCREVRFAHEKASEKSVTAEIRRKAPKSIGGRKAGFARK